MVELVGTDFATETFREYLHGRSVILLVDTHAVEGALVKGYSARTDVCELIGKFWDLALELDCSIYILFKFLLMQIVQIILQGTSCRSVSHLAGKRFWLGGPGRFGLKVGPGYEI